MLYRPVDWSVAPDSGAATASERTNLYPGSLWRRGKLAALLHDLTPKAACRQDSGADNIYWLHDRSRGMLGGWNGTSDAVSAVRLLPTNPGAVTATASSEEATVTAQVQVGTYTGNGVDGHQITGLGFQPAFLLVKAGSGTLQAVMAHQDFPAGESRDFNFPADQETDCIKSLDADGFTVGDDVKVNQDGVTYHWIAFYDDGSDVMRFGTYTGNGVDSRDIDIGAPAFQPDFVLVTRFTGTTGGCCFRTSDIAGDKTASSIDNNDYANGIQALKSTGFQVGTGSDVNGNGVEYAYVAAKKSILAAGGTYTGDGSDDRAITGVGLQPDSVWIKGTTNNVFPVNRPSTESGDNTHYFTAGAKAANLIQSLDADGFTIGSSNTVNQTGIVFRWWAWKAGSYLSVGDYQVENVVDEDYDTSWEAEGWTEEQWVQTTLAAAANVDSVKVYFSEQASGTSSAQSRVRGLRIRPSSHQDTTRTAAAICGDLVDEMTAHSLNRAYIFCYEMPTGTTGYFWFDTGTSDYQGFGSDGADFLATFIPLAAAAGIEVYACLPYLQNYAYGLANDKGLETNGGVYSYLWLCPSKAGVLTWYDAIIATLLTYSVDGVDFAEPQWGFAYGNAVCWCSECQAAFAAAHAGEKFGKESPEGVYTTDSPTITTWEQWRADVLTAAISADIADVQAAGKACSVVSFFGINPDGRQLDLNWKLVKEGLDWLSVIDAGPDEAIWQMTWQEKAAGSKDYVTFSPEWVEYGVRWALANHNGRAATPIVHIGGYPTVAASGTDFSYGYDHTLTAAEHLRALKAAARGGAIHFEGYAWHTFEGYSLWGALDSFWTSDEYNSVLGEVQWNDGGTWRPVGRQAWFNTRSGFTDWTAHFARKTEDEFRVYFYPAPSGDRELAISEIELRAHSIQSSDLSNLWGGIDFDNAEGGTADLWAARYTVTQAYMHRIDESTGLDAGGGPWAFDNYDVQAVNDLCVLPTGAEPRLLLLSQGDLGARARLQRYSTAAPGTLASTAYPNLGHHKIGYGGLAYQPSSVDGTAYLVFAVNVTGIGQRFYWADPDTLVESGGRADSELGWLWGATLCWAGTLENDFLFGEYGGNGVFFVRRVGQLGEGSAESEAANLVIWQQSSLTLYLHPEKALTISTTSRRTLIAVRAYVWEDDASGYGLPTVAATAVAADGAETSLGNLSLEESWGNVRMLSLPLDRVLPECQYVNLVVTRKAAATYIGILEVTAIMATTLGDVMEDLAEALNDAGMGDYTETQLRKLAVDAYCETVVAADANKEDVPAALVEDETDYSLEPCYFVTSLSLGGQELTFTRDVDADMAEWSSSRPGVPSAWRQQTGATIRLNRPPDADALGMVSEIEEAPTAGGSDYAVGDILTLAAGNSDAQVRVAAVSGGVVTALELLQKDRSTRGTGYSVASGIATTGGSGSGCTVEITELATLEATGYSGVTRPTLDSDVLSAIPEHLIRPAVVPRGMARALRNRKDGTHNTTLAKDYLDEARDWAETIRRALRRKGREGQP